MIYFMYGVFNVLIVALALTLIFACGFLVAWFTEKIKDYYS